MKTFQEFATNRLDERSIHPSALLDRFREMQALVSEINGDLVVAIKYLTKEDHTDVTTLIKRRIDSTVRVLEDLERAVKLPLRFKDDSEVKDDED